MPRVSLAMMIGAGMALLAVFLIHHTFADVYQRSYQAAGRGPVFFPRILLGILLVLSVAVMIEARKDAALQVSWDVALRMVLVLLATGGYVLAVTKAGFLLASIGFALILPPLLGYRRLLPILVIAALYPVCIWYLFDRIVRIPLPSSPWFVWF
ncbi:MAG: tripartite tricarboxylate transporter TctB family protein [Pararhodobacter sp.]|nr:tripartite tricarboxylate transporter TctB family protein [Pararhodobacter sp.]